MRNLFWYGNVLESFEEAYERMLELLKEAFEKIGLEEEVIEKKAEDLVDAMLKKLPTYEILSVF